MDNIFNSVKLSKPARNLFDLSFDNKLTLRFGELVPVLCQEMLPGDEVRLSSEVYTRFMPLLAPIMHKVDVSVHNFFVPNRLIFDQWNDFLVNNTANGTLVPVPPSADISDVDPIIMPSTTLQCLGWCVNSILNNGGAFDDQISQVPIGTLADYLGIPTTGVDTSTSQSIRDVPYIGNYADIMINLLPFRAYQLIYNEYYRDENLIPELVLPVDGGYRDDAYWWDPDHQQEMIDLFTLRKRAWKKDYFTASLPWTQRGSQVVLPIVGTAPVYGTPVFDFGGVTSTGNRHWLAFNTPNSSGRVSTGNLTTQNFAADGVWNTNLLDAYADIGSVNTTTINDFRTALRVQEWLEKNARCGSRYIEQIMAHFGVMTPDARLQRPEFLGGSRFTVNIGEVMQTAPFAHTEESTYPPGIPFGKASAYDNRSSVHYYCYEHGFLMTIVSVMPKANYFQGISRMWTRMSAMDYYWPEFANLGEQATRRKEIFVPYGDPANFPNPKDPDEEFGYMPRYMEYRCNEDTIHCDFRESLKYWHLARIFTDEPDLNQDFIEVRSEADGLERIFSIFPEGLSEDLQEAKHLYYGKPILMEIFHDFRALRPLPVYAVPSIV